MEQIAANVVLGASLVWSAKILSGGFQRGMERAGMQTIDHMREHGPHVVFPAKPLNNDGQWPVGKGKSA